MFTPAMIGELMKDECFFKAYNKMMRVGDIALETVVRTAIAYMHTQHIKHKEIGNEESL